MLGYALTHPRRLQAALGAEAGRTRMEEALEAALGLVGAGPGPTGRAFLDRQAADLSALHQKLAQAAGPLGDLAKGFAAIGGNLAALPGKLAALVEATDPAALRQALSGMLEAVIAALFPAGGDPAQALADRALSLFDLMEAPFKAGDRSPSALRGVRAAATWRNFLRPLFDILRAPGGAVDLPGEMRAALDAGLANLEAQQLQNIATAVRGVAEQIGPLLEAIGKLEVRVEVHAGGPQPAPGADPTWEDDHLPVPHESPGHPLSIIDAVSSGIVFVQWWIELFRTREWQGRGGNLAPFALSGIWIVVRALVRLFGAKGLNEAAAGSDAGKKFGAWLFTDQGDFWVQFLFRLNQTWYETVAANNWFLSFGTNLLKQHVFNGIPRMLYQFSRAMWYFDQRRNLPQNTRRHEVSPSRIIMGLWSPATLVGLLWGMAFMPWGSFSLELLTKVSRDAGPFVLMIVGVVLALAAGYITTGAVANENPFALTPADDWGTFATLVIGSVVGLAATFMIMSSIESGSKKGVMILLVVLSIILGGLAIALGATLAGDAREADGSPSDSLIGAGAVFQVMVGILGLVGAAVVPMILGWFIVDDGRDKPGYFKDKPPDTSPYRLPYPAGEGWLVGQGPHGIFSHYATQDQFTGLGNAWSYDFNNRENATALAARDAIVVELMDWNPNGESEQNDLTFMNIGWVNQHDPGPAPASGTEAEEGVVTYVEFVHLSKQHVWVAPGQRVAQGLHVADIDDTGRSAQHHLHVGVVEYQSGRDRGIAHVYKDDGARGIRGFTNTDGKPISLAMYKSGNTRIAEPPRAAGSIAMSTAPASATVPEHTHLLRLDPAALPENLADGGTFWTSIAEGHAHQLQLTGAQLAALLRRQLPSPAPASTEIAGHTHTLTIAAPRAVTSVFAKIESAPADHWHRLVLDPSALPDPLPATITLTSEQSFGHSHDVTLTAAQLEGFLRRRAPDPPVRFTATAGHSHELELVRRLEGSNAQEPAGEVALVAPPNATLLLKQPAPSALLGERLALRVNDRATAWWLWGGTRPAIDADIALDGGIGAGTPVVLAGDAAAGVLDLPLAVPNDTRRASLVATAEVLSTLAAPRGVTAIALPVLSIETAARGSDAQLSLLANVGAGASRAIEGSPSSKGAGALPDLGSVTHDAFAAYLQGVLRTGWGAGLAGIATGTVATGLSIKLGTAAITPAASSARLASVLAPLYDSTSSTLRALSPLPLSEGRIALSAAVAAPVLASPAIVRLDTAHASMTGAARAATPLQLVMGTAVQEVRFDASEQAADAATLARRIMQRAEGVRASADGTSVRIETVAAGSGAQLGLRKGGTQLVAPVSGASALLPTALARTDAVPRDVLKALLDDAKGRAAPLYDVAANEPTVTVAAGILTIAVKPGKAIAFNAWQVPGVPDPGLANPAGDTTRLVAARALPDPLRIEASGWIDLTVDGRSTRIPLDGAPARLDLVLKAMPAAGETWRISTGAGTTEVNFATSPPNLVAVAEKIGEANAAFSVRIAYRLSLAAASWGGLAPSRLALQGAAGSDLASAGYLRTDALEGHAVGPGHDPLAVPAPLPGPAQLWPGVAGAFFSAEPPVPGAALRIQADAGLALSVTAVPPVGALAAAPVPAGSTPDPALHVTAPLPDRFALGAHHQQLLISAHPAAPAAPAAPPAAQAVLALDAAPAVLRSEADAVLPPRGDGTLAITVTGPGPDDAATGTADLAGAATLHQVAARIMAAVPALRASVAGGRIAVETAGGGTGWGLRLSGVNALAALGFRPDAVALKNGAVEAAGRGNVADGRSISRDELTAALREAIAGATVLRPPGTGAPWPVQVLDAGGSLSLRAIGGTLTLDSRPAWLAGALRPQDTPDGARKLAALDGAGTAALDDGLLLLQVGSAVVAAAEIHAAAARVRSDNPLAAGDGTAEALRRRGPLIDSETEPHILPAMPATVPDDPAAIAAWIGRSARSVRALIDDAGRLVVESRLRGSRSSVRLSLAPVVAAFPGGTPVPATLLGFTLATGPQRTDTRPAGADTVADLAKVTRAELAAALAQAVARGDGPQALVTGQAAAGNILRATAAAPNMVLSQAAPPPATHPVFAVPAGAGPGPVVEAPWVGSPPLAAGVTRFDLVTAEGPRQVRVPLLGSAARLLFKAPNVATSLAGKTLELRMDGGTTASITFTSGDLASIARQIEAAAPARLRARVEPNAFPPEPPGTAPIAGIAVMTAKQGASARITMTGGNAVTDNRATGFSFPGRSDAGMGEGDGTLPDMAGADAAALVAAIRAGWLSQGLGLPAERPVLLAEPTSALPYGSDERRRTVAAIRSSRTGLAGRLLRIAPAAAPPWLDETLAQGPAVRAAIVSKPLPEAGVAISGTLTMRFNENGSAAGLPGTEDVQVAFAGGLDLTAESIAGLIAAALEPRGLGFAAATPDRRVVIETAAPGAAGSVAAVQPGGATAPDPFAVLFDPAHKADRGWPGAARTGTRVVPLLGAGGHRFISNPPAFYPPPLAFGPLLLLAPGWRARRSGSAAADATWVFELAGAGAAGAAAPVASLPVHSGDTAAATADSLDAALAGFVDAGVRRRVGLARLDPDGFLVIEALDDRLTFAVQGAATPKQPGDAPGRQFEAPAEPAFGLSATHDARTVRLARDPDGKAELARADSWGWIRLPTDGQGRSVRHATATVPFKDWDEPVQDNHALTQFQFLPRGRWWIAVRAEAAKTDAGYDHGAEMIPYPGTGLAALRYWPALALWRRPVGFLGNHGRTPEDQVGFVGQFAPVLLPDGRPLATFVALL